MSNVRFVALNVRFAALKVRFAALISAKLVLVYGIIMSTATTGVCGTTAYSEEYHRWTVEYNGNYYEYVADTYDNPNAYIIDLDGNKIYVTVILGGDNR